jgi:cyclopropane fatty-acyl-phospholipid synthase-like methyltransferase
MDEDRYLKQWDHLGSSDPYWAVLTVEDKKNNKWNHDAFFLQGEGETLDVFKQLENLGVTSKPGTALDFGCGVGRISRALATRFEHVLAVDFSPSMLSEARRVNSEFHNIEYLQNAPSNLDVLNGRKVDFLYSVIVLQHMPKKRQIQFIKCFSESLNDGGILIFQTPSRRVLTKFSGILRTIFPTRLWNFLRTVMGRSDTDMEVHSLHRRKVTKVLAESGMELLNVQQDNWPGPKFVSFTYYARRS